MRELEALQRHTTARIIPLPATAVDLWRRIRAALIKASNARKIVTSPKEIEKYVALLDEPRPQVLDSLRKRDLHRGAFCIAGGEKNQNRDRGLPHFERDDGAWFDFTITVREQDDGLQLLAYDFEIRLMPGMGASFLRFDLNLPEHANQQRELRCHLHPGSDDMLVPAPMMSPLEVLDLFTHGARTPVGRKPRTPTEFDVGWLQQTLEGATPR
jgi:hypothetical protein